MLEQIAAGFRILFNMFFLSKAIKQENISLLQFILNVLLCLTLIFFKHYNVTLLIFILHSENN